MNDSTEKIPELKTEFAWSEIEGKKLVVGDDPEVPVSIYKDGEEWFLVNKSGPYEIRHFGLSEISVNGFTFEIGREVLVIREKTGNVFGGRLVELCAEDRKHIRAYRQERERRNAPSVSRWFNQ